jgi:hypothetical protein
MSSLDDANHADHASRQPRQSPKNADLVYDAVEAFFREHQLCGVLQSAVDDETHTISLTCRRCHTSLVLPLA